MKPMINVGQRQSSREKQIQLLLEKGYDIYVLRLRKLTEYGQTLHGFDDILVKAYRAPNSMAVDYRLEMRPCSYATFEPDEDNVATAYVPGTKRNIDVIASHLYSPQFILMEILTPNGIIPRRQAIERIKQRADEIGIAPDQGTDAYAAYLQRRGEQMAERQNPGAGQAQQAQPIQEQRPTANPVPELPKDAKEARKMAEDQVHTKYQSLLDFIQKKSPNGWKSLGEYKSVVKPEIEQVEAELLKLAGIDPATPQDPPPAADQAAGEGEGKEQAAAPTTIE